MWTNGLLKAVRTSSVKEFLFRKWNLKAEPLELSMVLFRLVH